jgi:hypothetical protein
VTDRISGEMMGNYFDEMWEEAISYIKGGAMGAQRLLGFKGFEGLTKIEYLGFHVTDSK